MGNTEKIKTSLSNLINSNYPFVAMISGEWGVGKTHFWKDFVGENKLKRAATISLFGHNSLDEIKTSIMTEIGMIQHDRFKELVERTKDLQFMGVGVGGFFSMFTREDLSEIVICFDDFERLSNKLDIKDVLGLISFLKEEKNCQIILILNENELDHDYEHGTRRSKIFARKKEKIVDYSFYYNPTVEELFQIVEKQIAQNFNKKMLQRVFQEIKLRNIRIMEQVIRQLNDFEFISDWGLREEIGDEFIEIALKFFVFQKKTNIDLQKFEEMNRYIREKAVHEINNKGAFSYDGKSFKKNQELERLNDEYSRYTSSYSVDKDLIFGLKSYRIIELLFDYMYTHIIDEVVLKEILSYSDFIVKRRKLQIRLWSDFSTPSKEICGSLLKLYQERSDEIIGICEIDLFHHDIEIMKEHEVSVEDTFVEHVIWQYLLQQPRHDSRNGAWAWEESHYLKFVQEYYPNLHSRYINEIKDKEPSFDIEQLKQFLSEKDWKELEKFDANVLKEFILKDSSIAQSIEKYLFENGQHSANNKIVTEIKKALRQIKYERPENTWRVQQICKNAKIEL